MEIDTLPKLFQLSNSYQNYVVCDLKQKFVATKSLVGKFTELRSIELNKLPYRLNLLDDLSTNENAHSKFLIRLLQYRPALLSFLHYLNNNSDSFKFDMALIDKPSLTWEKMRIDGLIKENRKYAIIIENKIHNAVEQKHQVGRYIEKCKAIGFKLEQIFVLYLTRTDTDTQSPQSWGEDYTLKQFKTRYSEISYKSDILLWLNAYLKELNPKEGIIKSAIVQYTDHLKHFFNKKEIYKNMNLELQNFLSKELDFKSDKAENVEVVIDKINELHELTIQLKALAKSTKFELFKEWKNKIIENYDFEESDVFCYTDPNHIKTGIKLDFNGHPFSILIEHNSNSTYFGFGRHNSSEVLDEKIHAFLASLINDEAMKPEEPWWYGWKYSNFKDGYADFDTLLKAILIKLKTTK